jgi:serine phosphatase RsbU (regulator of sigma subunit)
VCFTDGIVERHRGRQFFEETGIATVLREAAGSDAASLAARIEQAARDLFSDSPHDDMAVLVVRVPPASPAGPAASTDVLVTAP